MLALPRRTAPLANRPGTHKPPWILHIPTEILLCLRPIRKLKINPEYANICTGRHSTALEARDPLRLCCPVQVCNRDVPNLELRVRTIAFAGRSAEPRALRDCDCRAAKGGCIQVFEEHVRRIWGVG